jgi:hypothetical protein|tara:strand:- start:283 stop:447 length:165 start_codon:yes stop_codon:yes gene_type:complete
MRPILILIGMILGLYMLNKKIPNEYILFKTLLSSGVAALSVILVAVIMLHFSGN